MHLQCVTQGQVEIPGAGITQVHMETPLKSSKNSSQSFRSSHIPRVTLMKWCGAETPDVARDSRVQKACPGDTTLQAKFKCPRTDWSCLRVHFLQLISVVSMLTSALTFSAGRLDVPWVESNAMPKYVRQSVGPSVLSGAKGTPSSSARF